MGRAKGISIVNTLFLKLVNIAVIFYNMNQIMPLSRTLILTIQITLIVLMMYSMLFSRWLIMSKKESLLVVTMNIYKKFKQKYLLFIMDSLHLMTFKRKILRKQLKVRPLMYL